MTAARAAFFARVVKEERIRYKLLNEPIEKRVAVPCEASIVPDG